MRTTEKKNHRHRPCPLNRKEQYKPKTFKQWCCTTNENTAILSKMSIIHLSDFGFS